MPLVNQIGHSIFIFVSILVIQSSIQYFKYRTPMANWGGLFLFSLSIELLSFAAQLVMDPSFPNPFWYLLQVISFYLLPIFWLLFVFEITGVSKWINLKLALVVLCVPGAILTILLLIWTRSPISHGPEPEFIGSLAKLPQIIGPYGLFIIVMFYALGSLSFIFLIRLCLNKNSFNQKFGLPMLGGTLLILGMSGLDLASFNLFKPVDMVQTGLAITGFMFFFISVIWRFGGVLPISRESVFEGLHDGVIILDYYDKVMDLNEIAQKIVGKNKKNIVRQNILTVFPLGAQLITEYPNNPLIEKECELSVGGQAYKYNLIISQFIGLNNIPTGRVIVLRNVTGQEQMEIALNERAQELQRTNAFMAALAEVNVALQSATDSSQINATLGIELKKLGLTCFIAQLDPVSNELFISYMSNQSAVLSQIEKLFRKKVIGFRLSRGQFPNLYAILDSEKITFRPFRSDDLAETPGKLPVNLLEQAIRLIGIDLDIPALVLPLKIGEHNLGMLGVWGSTLRESDIPPFQIFANQVAHMMERTVLYESEIKRSTELTRANSLVVALSEVASVLGTTSNSDRVFETLGNELQKAGLQCAVVSFDEDIETAFIKYLSIKPEVIGAIEKLIGIQLKNHAIPKRLWPGDRIKSNGQKPIWYQSAHDVFQRLFPMAQEGIGKRIYPLINIGKGDQFCIIPLRVGDQVIGAMPIWGPQLRQKDTPILSVFGGQVAGIIHNVAAYENEVQRTGELEHSNVMIVALSNVAAQLDTTTDLPQVFETLGNELKKVHVNCMVGTLDDDKQVMKIEYLSIPKGVFEWTEKLGIHLPSEFTIPRRLWPTDKAVTEKAPSWDPDPIGSLSKMFTYIPRNIVVKMFEMAGIGVDDHMCYLPMISEEDVIGILGVWGPNLKQEDILGLSVFANQVATAIRNTRLYEQAQKEIVVRTQAESRVREALNEKEVLLKEVHHRVKNNLQVISSLLNLQASQITDPNTINILHESQNRVRSMALIHEKLYQSNDLARIDFGGYLQSLVNSLAQTYRVNPEKVKVLIHSEKIALNIDTAVPCGLIVNELVSNSLKYGFPGDRSGSIEVSCQYTRGDRIALVVRDDGIGLPHGFDATHSPSLGLKLVNSLTRQVEGEIVVDGNNGTRFEINFFAT